MAIRRQFDAYRFISPSLLIRMQAYEIRPIHCETGCSCIINHRYVIFYNLEHIYLLCDIVHVKHWHNIGLMAHSRSKAVGHVSMTKQPHPYTFAMDSSNLTCLYP